MQTRPSSAQTIVMVRINGEFRYWMTDATNLVCLTISSPHVQQLQQIFISHTKSSSFRLNTRPVACFPSYDELPNTENRLTKLGPYSS